MSFVHRWRRLHIHGTPRPHAARCASHRGMGKAISLLRPPQPPREGEREGAMELRKRPSQPRVDPDFISSPPALLLRKRARRQAPAKRPREAAGQQRPRKRTRCAGAVAASPVAPLYPESYFRLGWPIPLPNPTPVLLRPLHPFNWYESDMWTEIAKHLYGYDLVSLSLVCRWFRRLLVDDSIWRHAFIRDLMLPASYVPPPRPFHRSWRCLYAAAFDGSHTYCYHQRQRHIDGSRIGGFLLDTSCVLLAGKLPLPRLVLQDVQLSIEMMGAGVVRNARPGIWIVDRHMVHCPACKDDGCTGVVQVLDIRHCELFLEEEFWDGTWEYEDLGEHFMDEVSATACCAIFNHNRLSLSYADILRNAKSWRRKQEDDDSRLKVCLTPYAVAINTNLNENGGLMSKFQAMRDTSGDGRIVAIRISQQLV